LEDTGGLDRAWRIQTVLSTALGVLYGVVLSLVAFDLIMSLDPHWYSTLFGAYYFVGSFYTGLAALVILLGSYRKREALGRFIHERHFHDLGKLLFAFCLLTGDFFYSQFLVIWYGNLPEDAQYVILRVHQSPWEPVAWVVLGVSFVLPFLVLLSRRIKLEPVPMMVLGGIILVGMWLERFLLVAPSLWKGKGLPIGVLEIGITAGFLGLMALSVTAFLRTFPLLPVSDPLFRGDLETDLAEAGR
jgi:Ni/Fe-hydrogenase subunit HybB-like protein